MPYIPRVAEARLMKILSSFPACLVTGSRQSGKSTMIRHTLPNYTFVSLDDFEMRQLANDDPKLFLQTYPEPLIIDEVQYAPKLFTYLKILIDQDRRKMGRFVLTGSQSLHLMEGVSESLAGRIGIFDLYPLIWEEILPTNPKVHLDAVATTKMLRLGFYPEIHVQKNIDPNEWIRSFLSSYVQRDVRDLKAIGDLHQFHLFIRMLAVRAGARLNLSEVAKEVGIAVSTAKSWLSILEGTYIVHLLRPFHNNAS